MPVSSQLFAEPWEFEFFQAVRLLELMNPKSMPAGEGTGGEQEVVRLRSNVGNLFAASEIQSIEQPHGRASTPEITVNLLPVAGAEGPLPDADSEPVIERTWRKDHAMLDFLDMFHHRLLSLLVRSRKSHHPSYTPLAPHEGPIAQYLYAFFGLAPGGLRNRIRVPDHALIYYSGILSQHPRSASGLERLLSDYFQAPARVVQLLGQWRPLEASTCTRLGLAGTNRTLGDGAILGTRVWDQQGRFEVTLGPLRLQAFLDFLPGGSAFDPLCELTRFYAGQDLDFSFRLLLAAAEVPAARIGQSCLGWTSWLKTRPFERDDSQVRLLSYRTEGPSGSFSVLGSN